MANTRTPFLYQRRYGLGELIIADGRFAPNNIYFVGSTASGKADSASNGQSPDTPFATIDYAIGQCTASVGDLILVLPGHVETITGAAGVALDVAGVSIIGLGNGRNRPQVNFTTAAAASWDTSAANCLVENLSFTCNIDDQTAMMNITAADNVVRNCEFLFGTATIDAEIGILTNGSADRLVLENLWMHLEGNTTVVAGAISFAAEDNIVIRGCNIQGYFGTTGNILNASAAVNVLICGNYLVNRTADANNLCINLNASTEGIIANNRMAVIDSTTPTPVVAAACFVSGNYFTGAVLSGNTASTLL